MLLEESITCPPAAPMLPVPSTIPVTVAKASWLFCSASCRPKSAEIAELIMFDGPPIRKPETNDTNIQMLVVS